MRIGVYANMELPGSLKIARSCSRLLRRGDCFEERTARELGKKGVPLGEMEADVLIVIGGDGTMLKTFMETGLPLLGINSGNVGFLTESRKDSLQDVFRRLRTGRFRIEEKLKIATTVEGRRVQDAVNEAVVHSSSIGKVRHFDISISRNRVGLVRSDGIIVSTPTGSTSYSLSAGGPIVDPTASVIVVSPLAPYGISSRPIVCGPDSQVRVKVVGERACMLVIDGQVEIGLTGSEKLEFSSSETRARFVRFDFDFYRRIHSKLTG